MKKAKYVGISSIVGLLILANPFMAFATTYDLFVDKNHSGSEDGTEDNPYNTVSEALAVAQDGNAILIKNGTYEEDINIPRGVKLYGEDKNKVIIKGGTSGSTVEMGHKSQLKKLTVQGGDNGIKVQKRAGVKIENVVVKDADKNGILLEGDGQTRSKDQRYKREIIDSTIEDNNKGLYIKKSNVVIKGSDIKDNDEEGIDIRKDVKATIKNNDIENNGEGNIEFKLDDVKLKISKNDIKKAGSSGIAAQSYQGTGGLAEIINNDIEKNDHYGIRCLVMKSSISNWFDRLLLTGNTFSGNKKGTFADICQK